MIMTAHSPDRSLKMGLLTCAIVLAIVSLIAGAFGATHNAGATVVVARLLSFLCVILSPVLLTLGIIIGKR
jgi:uncharacterized membrane protein YtjA (UPF0391 family)